MLTIYLPENFGQLDGIPEMGYRFVFIIMFGILDFQLIKPPKNSENGISPPMENQSIYF